MKKIVKITSTAVVLAINNVDTDQIIPARFLKTTSMEEFGRRLFYDWRYRADGTPEPDFALNRMKGDILIAGGNFGCGSSREHAAWALADYGFRAVISSSFADIFKNNALNNGLLPVQVSEEFLSAVTGAVLADGGTVIIIDLSDSTVSVPSLGLCEKFPISAFKRDCLMEGLDDIDYLVKYV